MDSSQGFGISEQQRSAWLAIRAGVSPWIQAEVVVEGAFCPSRFREALYEVMQAHEILRTRYLKKAGIEIPFQFIDSVARLDWSEENLVPLPPQEQNALLAARWVGEWEQAESALDPAHVQVRVFRRDAERHVLWFKCSCMSLDDQGTFEFLRKVHEHYEASEGALNGDVVQYVDYSEWQNSLRSDFARPELRPSPEAIPTLRLPFVKRFPVGRERRHWSTQSRSMGLQRWDLRSEASLEAVLLSCCQMVFLNLTGCEQFSLKISVTGRHNPEVSAVLGCFQRALTLNADLRNVKSFPTLAQANAARLRELSQVSDQVFLSSDLAGSDGAEFPVCFEFRDEQIICGQSTRIELTRIWNGGDRSGLKLRFQAASGSVRMEAGYLEDLYRETDIVVFLDYLEEVIKTAQQNPRRSINKLLRCATGARFGPRTILEGKAVPLPDACIHELIAAQARRTPEKIAVRFEEKSWTYGQLEDAAEKLACRLQKLGVGPDMPVALFLEHSDAMIVALYGVLKSGGAYSPIDPELPFERVVSQLDILAPVVVVSKTLWMPKLPAGNHITILLDDVETHEGAAEGSAVGPVNSTHLAYVLFTSGSTGVPKGVMIEHRQLVNYLTGIRSAIDTHDATNFAMASTFAADLANTVIFLSLTSGGCLHIIPLEKAADPSAFAACMRRHRIDVLKVVPSHLQALLEYSPDVLPNKVLVLGGAVLRWSLVEKIKTSKPGCRVFNHYGPTETTVGVTVYAVTEEIQDTDSVPIGSPLPNTQIYVLDSGQRPVPFWVPGEIYIAGHSLARGYLNCPDLSETQFVYSPWIGERQTRLYRTGDYGRVLPQGWIEFLGRKDDQIKVRGFRVELGEIEAVLRRCPSIADAIVLAKKDADQDVELVAYLIRRQDDGSTALTEKALLEAVRDFLNGRLPQHMRPKFYVWLENFPLNANGKVNRGALPEPDREPGREPEMLMLARNPVEELLASVWGEVLNRQQVDVHDNFFDLGGHSLLATQLISRLRDAFGVELPIRDLFEAPTVAKLAKRVEAARRGGMELPVPPLAKVERNDDIPLSYAQERLWFLDQFEPGSATYNAPGAIRIKGKLSIEALEHAISEIIRRHESLRTTFGSKDGRPIQIVHAPQAVNLSVIDLAGVENKKLLLKQLVTADVEKPFDLNQGPLIRVQLARVTETEHVLFFTAHHIVSDGWSKGILVREFGQLYDAFFKGQSSPLPELPVQYADYAAWQRGWLQGEVLAKQLSYWKERLKGSPSLLTFPSDRSRPAVQSYGGAIHGVALSPQLSSQLKKLQQREAVTLFMVLCAAFKVLLHRYTGQVDIVMGSPIANRNREQIEGLIGLFVNMLVLRTDLGGDPMFVELLKQEREVAFGAYEHQDMPFEQLVQELSPNRNMSHSPLFQVMIALQNTPRENLEIGGLEVEPFDWEQRTAKFDLTLALEESDSQIRGVVEYNTDLFSETTIRRIISHWERLLENIVENPERRLSELEILSAAEKEQLLIGWNNTRTEYPTQKCIHERFEEQVERTPDAIAVVCQEQQMTYRELNERANQLAHYLRRLGIDPEDRVGICVERGIEMVVGLLGILKAGGAYVPLDPNFPRERLGFMLDDAQPKVSLTQEYLTGVLPGHEARVVYLDASWGEIEKEQESNPAGRANSENAAYLIFTSGSTGRPKGVVVQHRNVLNFFTGMDRRVGWKAGASLLALTTISFDISVLELFWTLTRGFRVVIQKEQFGGIELGPSNEKTLKFSLFYFANDEEASSNKYELLLEGARFADRHGFEAVWTPERHFHPFGGIYPNPAITSAAMATITKKVKLRAGSVVLPLHNPIRVAEELSVVDNLSGGRIGISVASGWHANDFAFFPGAYADRRNIMFRDLEVVRKLWRGEGITCQNGIGGQMEVKIHPRPIQKELPVWVTSAGNPATFEAAGQGGFNLLTHLLKHDLAELARHVAIYRQAWQQAGHKGRGSVALLVHTFVHPDMEFVRATVREPFKRYLRSSADLLVGLAEARGYSIDFDDYSEADWDVLLSAAFEKFLNSRSLMGTPQYCLEMTGRLKTCDVDEIGCLIDFGVEPQTVISSLPYLAQVKREEERRSRDSIAAQIRRHRVTHLQCTPSLAQALVSEANVCQCFESLETWMLGGEPLPVSVARDVRAATKAEILNMYGPTETTVWSTVDRVNPEEEVTIGTPIANSTIYICDANGRPTPTGIAGELRIGGDGVVRGYLNRPELTAERFVPDPFGKEPGARLYRTGDLARYRSDGKIEFLGRNDRQVKIRGLRIELDEIESVLLQHPHVAQAVVTACGDMPADRKLVAYIVFAEMKEITTSELRQFLAGSLPEYMVPSAFVRLERLPLTLNGKIDKNALPALDVVQAQMKDLFVAPRTPVEELMAGIWREVLELELVGVTANFFELGGHSLLATKLISRVREAFALELALRQLFENPTIAGLSKKVEEANRGAPRRTVPPLVRAQAAKEVPLSYAQERLWVLHQFEPGSMAFNIPGAVRLKGRLSVTALEQAISEIVARHRILRTTFEPRDDGPVQVINPAEIVKLAVADLEAVEDAERESWVREIGAEEVREPFDLSKGPLIRITLVRLAELEHVLFFTVHHIVSDGWSTGILVREFVRLYEAFSKGQCSPLPELPIQYSDYAMWQRKWLQGEMLEEQLNYWKEWLNGAPLSLELPTDRARPTVQTYRGQRELLSLAPEVTQSLKALSQREGTTLFIALSAAFKVLLNYYTGQEDVVVGSPIANRNRIETEALIGFFVNMLVLRTNLSGDPTLRESLKRERETALGAYQHQDAPFEKLVEALRPLRDTSRHPLFQVVFAMQDFPQEVPVLPELKMEMETLSNLSAKTDLQLLLGVHEGAVNGVLEYNGDLFDRGTIRNMVRDFQTILKIMVSRLDTRLNEIREMLRHAAEQHVSERQTELKKANARKLHKRKQSFRVARKDSETLPTAKG